MHYEIEKTMFSLVSNCHNGKTSTSNQEALKNLTTIGRMKAIKKEKYGKLWLWPPLTIDVVELSGDSEATLNTSAPQLLPTQNGSGNMYCCTLNGCGHPNPICWIPNLQYDDIWAGLWEVTRSWGGLTWMESLSLLKRPQSNPSPL